MRLIANGLGGGKMDTKKYLTDHAVPFEVIVHHDTYDAQRMAQTIGVAGRHVAKTVLLRANGGYVYIVAVLPADTLIDWDAASHAMGESHLELATEVEMCERCPDCECGALPPFGSQYAMKTLLDEALAEDEWMYFEGNTHHETIRLKVADFRKIENPLVARFSRPPHASLV
jgi:Ala-tRNA(Pro) deacylase